MIKISAQVADFVVAPGEADSHVEVAGADQRDLFLQFDHGALDQVGQHRDRHSADDDGSGSGDHEDGVAFPAAQRDGGDGEEEQSRQQHEDYRQDRLDLPIDPNLMHAVILSRPELKRRIAPQLRAESVKLQALGRSCSRSLLRSPTDVCM